MVDTFAEIPRFIGSHIIQGIFVSLALLILVRYLFKGKIETHISLEIIRWTLIIYCFIALFSWLLLLIFPHSEKYALEMRATGPYAWAYWLMFLMNSVVPLVLLNKYLGKKIYFIFILTLAMNFGWIFERFILLVTSLHRDYGDLNYEYFLISNGVLRILARGFFIGIIALLLGNGIKKYRVN